MSSWTVVFRSYDMKSQDIKKPFFGFIYIKKYPPILYHIFYKKSNMHSFARPRHKNPCSGTTAILRSSPLLFALHQLACSESRSRSLYFCEQVSVAEKIVANLLPQLIFLKIFVIIIIQNKERRFLYMFNMEDILTRLQNGEDPEVIAEEFTDALNGAIDKQREDEAANKEKEELNTYLSTASEALKLYVEKKYPEVDRALLTKLTDENSLAELIEGLVVALDALSPLLDAFVAIEEEKDKEEEKPVIKINPSKSATLQGTWNNDDGEIASFLKAFNL